MINDDFEYDIAASMDDLEFIPAQSAKPTKFQMPLLPEIDENSTYCVTSTGSTSNMSTSSSDTFRVPEPGSGMLRKAVLINNTANENIIRQSDTDNNNQKCDDNLNATAINNPNNSSRNNNYKNNTNTNNNNIWYDNGGTGNNTQITGARRKFIVTRMDSNTMLRPEAEHLRHLSEKTNAATISFPCSAAANHRQPLSGLFASNSSFGPHLDKRFFDSSLVEVRIKTNSTQSLNAPFGKNDVDSVWERRQIDAKNAIGVSACVLLQKAILHSLHFPNNMKNDRIECGANNIV